MSTTTDAFEGDTSEAGMSLHIARLEETVCHLLRSNEELREEVRELTSLLPKTRTQADE